MSTTAQTLIDAAFNLIGVLTQGESPTSTESTDALAVLNSMLDAWSIERLAVPLIERHIISLVAGDAAYTIGTGGDFNDARPGKILRGAVINNANPSQPLEIPMKQLSVDEWAEIRIKDLTQAFPTRFYYEPSYPLGTIRVWPVPTDSSYQLAMYYWVPVGQFADLVTSYDLPPGYDLAIRYGLAVELLPSFGVVGESSTLVIQKAQELKGNLKVLNAPKVLLGVDPEICATRGAGMFDWRTGETV